MITCAVVLYIRFYGNCSAEKYEKLKRFRNPIQQRQISLTKRVLSLVDAG